MAVLFSSWWTEFYFVVLSGLSLYYLYYKLHASKFWKKNNVPHMEPLFLLGNVWQASFQKNMSFILSDIHQNWKEKKMVGFWNFITPSLLITDLDIIKNILTRDFNYFRDRGFPVDFHTEPLAEHLFNVGGATWRNLRVKLTPTFTTGKMKMMFPTMVQCGNELQARLEETAATQGVIEVKDILARFTTDVISSCAFGIETNSLKNPDSEFREYGKKIFQPTLSSLLTGILMNVSPFLVKILKLKFIPDDVTDFFLSLVKDTMESREKNNIKRNDFLELLIQLKKKGRLEDVDGVIPITPDGEGKPTEDIEFTLNRAAAQVFVFFAAGFETSSTALSFALYELALNPEVQTTLQKEIDENLEKNQYEMTYEAIHKMEYLDCVVQETLRKYPPVTFLFRHCNKEYEIPELKAVIPKKSTIMISVYGLHHDPENYPEPEKFDPERFLPENKGKRHHYAFLPFGEGPRNCIGNRFGLMQTKVGLVSILSKFRIERAKDTPVPLKYDKKAFVLATESGIPLKITKRTTTTSI